MLTAMPQHHTDSSGSTYASPPSGASPWQHHHQQLLLRADRSGGHLLPYGYGDDSVANQTRAPAPHQRQQHRAGSGSARRSVAKRRPRPSRRLPTTYISADPAEFRRMVHQVTGADDLLLLPPPRRPEELKQDQDQLLLSCYRHPASAPGATLLLPTLDTSAFLLGRARTTHSYSEAPPPCDTSAAAGLLPLDNNNTSGGAGGFPTLESWDLL